MGRGLVISVAFLVSIGAPCGSIAAQGARADTTHWVYDVTPYVWASGMRGDVGLRDRSAHVDVSFAKILEHLDGAFMLPFEARLNRLGVGAEVIYTKVSDEKARPGILFTGASVSASTFIGSIGPRFRVATTKNLMVDAIFEARLWRLRNEVTLNVANRPDIRSTRTKSWGDIVGGARAFYKLNDRWLVQLRGDFGGFKSRETWQGLGLVGYTASSRVTLRAGYRQLNVNFHDGSDDFLYEVGLGGPILGATIRF